MGGVRVDGFPFAVEVSSGAGALGARLAMIQNVYAHLTPTDSYHALLRIVSDA